MSLGVAPPPPNAQHYAVGASDGMLRTWLEVSDIAEKHPPDPIVVADQHWTAHGWRGGPHLRASLSIYRVDDVIRVAGDDVLRPRRLTRAKHEALAVLDFSRGGEMPLGKLGEWLLVHPTSVTATVDALERLGFVRRVSHPTDRRTTLAQITPKGRRAVAETCRAMGARRCGLGALDDDDAQRVFELLVGVRADAGDLKRPDHRASEADVDGEHDPVRAAERHWDARGWTAGPAFRAALSIYRTAELVRESNDAVLRPFELTHVRHEALALLYFSRPGEMPMGRLSARLALHPTSVTGTVDTLERLGYVRRVAHPSDRRTTLARITPKGRRAIEATIQGMSDAACGLGALSTRATHDRCSCCCARSAATPVIRRAEAGA